MLKRKTTGEKIFLIVNLIIMIIACLSIVIPLINIVAVSFSSKGYIDAGEVTLWPVGFTLDSYKYIFGDDSFVSSFFVSIFVTVVGTAISLVVSTLAAYPLSKPDLRHRRGLVLFFVFTMMFAGGLVPSYIVVQSLGLLNTIWALILPMVMSVYNMLLLKNFMEGLPDSLEESAMIDGSSDFRTFLYITLPLCKPVIATVGLFYAVGYWNSYFPGIMYINDPSLKPLQARLYELLQASTKISQLSPEMQQRYSEISSQGIEAATIIVATLPILLVYPFLQKHFVKGIVVGSEK